MQAEHFNNKQHKLINHSHPSLIIFVSLMSIGPLHGLADNMSGQYVGRIFHLLLPLITKLADYLDNSGPKPAATY